MNRIKAVISIKTEDSSNSNVDSPPLLELEKMEEDAFASQRPTRNLCADEIQNLIPPFNPNSSFSLNSEEWIDEVENVSALNNWTDELTILYASLRLEEESNIWFRANRCDWQQFKSRFVKEFPITHHRSQYLGQLLKRRKEDAETFEDYVNDVALKAWKCNFNLPTAISYIISGLSDANMRNRLIAYNCKSISEVLSRIQTITFNQQQEAKWENARIQETCEPKGHCQNCQNEPASGKELQKTTKRRPDEEEPSIEPPEKKPSPSGAVASAGGGCTSSIPDTNYDWSDLVITVKIADVFLRAFVNLASKFTTLQKSEFQKHRWKLHPCDIKLQGFRQGLSKVLGKTNKTVIAGQVEMLIEILVVEDVVQNYPIILGRNFLHNPNVCVIKNFEGLEINFVETTTPTKKKRKRKRKRNKSSKKRLGETTDEFENEKQTLIFEKEIILRVREEKSRVTVIKREEKDLTTKQMNTGPVEETNMKEIVKYTSNDIGETDQTNEEQILDILKEIENEYL